MAARHLRQTLALKLLTQISLLKPPPPILPPKPLTPFPIRALTSIPSSIKPLSAASPFSSAAVDNSGREGGGGDGDEGGGIGRGYLRLSDEQLMGQCQMETFKASGPGGQHRNKRESAVRLKHLPTGIVAQAVEDRSQHMNQASALARLRVLLALKGNASLVGFASCCWGFCIKSSTMLGVKVPSAHILQTSVIVYYGTLLNLFLANCFRLSTGAVARLILSDDNLRMAVNGLRSSKFRAWRIVETIYGETNDMDIFANSGCFLLELTFSRRVNDGCCIVTPISTQSK
ncbi:Peptide chain release factor 2-like protein [Drosera capensis]